MVDRTLGHYRVLEKLGEGGMGEVYLAEDQKLEREVALKVLPSELASSQERLERFEREAKAVAALNHPNIVHVYSVEETDGLHFFTMELVEGENLAQVIPPEGIPLDQFFDLAIPLADALSEAHDQGIIHRDLKPANIMVDQKGRPKILDFGLAKLHRTVPAVLASEAPTEVMTEPGVILGTYPYMSPEQAEGKETDHRSDLFSFGIVLYEMASGQRPFAGDSPVSLISSILKDEPRPLLELRGDLPEGLNSILRRCLEKKPKERYPNAAELLRDIDELRLAVESGIAMSALAEAKAPAFLTEEDTDESAVPVFVGREAELRQLDGFLDQAVDEQGQVVFVTGEAGTGKTALVQAFMNRAQAANPELVAAVGSCSAHTGPGDPYAPFRQVLALVTGDVEALWRAGVLSRDQAQRLWALIPKAATSMVEFGSDLVETLVPGEGLLRRTQAAATGGAGWLRPLENLIERKLNLPPDVMLQQSAVFGQCTRLLQDLATDSPILLVLEDVHWSDAGSVDLFSHLSRHLAGHRILIVATFRPSEVTAGRGEERHPLESVIHETERSFGDCELHLSQEADLPFVHELIDAESNRLGEEFRERLFRRTRGHALFTVELLRTMQERGMVVKDEEGFWAEGADLDWEALPAQVDGVISERVGRLSEELRELLKVASVEGENFTAEVLSRTQKAETRETVRLLSQELERRHRLVVAEGLNRVNSNRLSLYRFLHVLFQKYLYDELDEAERAYLHEDVGNALEELFDEQTEEIAAQLARHFEEAGVLDKAIRYRAMAGQRAVRMAANREAIGHYRRAIDLLVDLPPSQERNETELGLQVAISSPLTMTEGWAAPGIRTASTRALELSDKLGGDASVGPALAQLSWYYSSSGNFPKGIQLAERMLKLAKELDDELQEAMAHWALGVTRGLCGELVAGREHLAKIEAFYSPDQHAWLAYVYGLDPGVAAKVHLGWLLAYLGFLDQSREKCDEGLALARSIGHPHTLGWALGIVGISDMRRIDWDSLDSRADEALALASEHGFHLLSAYDCAGKGLALAALGEVVEGISLIRRGLAGLQATGAALTLPVLLEMLARAYAFAGQWDQTHRTLDEMLRVARETGEVKLLKLEPVIRGIHFEQAGDSAAAEECLLRGLELARSCEAKLFELQGATSLARIWSSMGRQEEAKELLGSVYDWFTEGFDEVPLKEARAVLDELG